MATLFISHSSKDDAFVGALRAALAALGEDVWIDSRELRGGDPLWASIQTAIASAEAFVAIVTPDAHASEWVGRELHHALASKGPRVFALCLDNTPIGAFGAFFPDKPLSLAAPRANVEAALNAILVAMGRRLPKDVAPRPQPAPAPLEELVLELGDLKFQELDGVRRASARARLVYQPAAPGRPEVASEQSWRLVAPIGPIEADDLRWYLEKYAIWPSGHFRGRAQKVEADLVTWGKLLYAAAMPVAHTTHVGRAWASLGESARRRFSVRVDATLEAGAPEADALAAREAATLLLGLPWELLHDGDAFLFQGATPTRVRRRLPNTRVLDVPVVATPIRVLLVTARPEDDACGYIDHRASALPLVEATEALGTVVSLHVLSPPTFAALSAELDRARAAGQAYHVVHFDGHGVYDRRVGLGGLCFEDPADVDQLDKRRHVTIYTRDLGPLLRAHRVPLVFLEACQTAQADSASESVASELLKVGVASVVAMSHSVLVETARRFVQHFYAALAGGVRVGDAMLAGQRALAADSFRGSIFGAGALHLQDWFVPVLYQEREDPQLFRATPSAQTQADTLALLQARLGALPPPPDTGFVGRSRELLALERLLRRERYAVVRGQGGEGKTTLAVELARWLVRSQQARRAVFVSVETNGNARAVLDAIGAQLVPGYSVAGFADLDAALRPVTRALGEEPTVIVVDNLESVLLPPFLEAPELLSEDARQEASAILSLCARLLTEGETRIVYTSREALPAPFDGARNRRELHRLGREDAIKLVERVLDRHGGAATDAGREAIEQLVDAVACHARTLALLAPSVRDRGVEATREALVELMEEMDRRFPGSRERSLYASVELSLRRMSPPNRERARVLGVFHGAVDLDVLRIMMEWEDADVAALAGELVETGLATPDPYNHLTLNPALCPYLRGRLEGEQREGLVGRWGGAMLRYVVFLSREQSERAELAAALTVMELPNLFALLEQVRQAGDAEATIGLATSLYTLLQMLARPRLLARVGYVRDEAAAALGAAWSHAGFQARRTRIEQQESNGQLREALAGAAELLERASTAGEKAYLEAGYDLAAAHYLLGRVLKNAGRPDKALSHLGEALRRFEGVAKEMPGVGAEGMASACHTERGDCLRQVGRLDAAALAYQERIRGAEALRDERGVAVGKVQLAGIWLVQRRYGEALKAYEDARERFAQLGEEGTVASVWHQIGLVHQAAMRPEAAEDAYRRSLKTKVLLGNLPGQASTLGQLGILYDVRLGRPEEAVPFLRQAADIYVRIGDVAGEGRQRNNLGDSLRKLHRLDQARAEVRRAIECKANLGHAAEPWTSWAILAEVETAANNPPAAAEARRNALTCYLAYRRDGGENHTGPGRLALDVTTDLRAGDAAAASTLLTRVAADSELHASFRPFVHALQSIVAGNRDRTLADAPDLHCTMAAELLLLIDTLEGK